jgi:hypothetical protein
VGKRRANSFLLVGMGGKRKGCKPFPTYGGERGEGRVVNPSYLGWGKEGKILSYLWVTGLRVSSREGFITLPPLVHPISREGFTTLPFPYKTSSFSCYA